MQRTFKAMSDKKVPMTSTVAVYELFVPNRPTRDQRALEAMAPEVREDYLGRGARSTAEGSPVSPRNLADGMEYEKAFVAAGGLIAGAWTRPATAARAGLRRPTDYEC